GTSVETGHVALTDARRGLEDADEVLGVLPAAGDARQPAGRAGRAETFERLEVLGADECRDRLAVAGDHDRLAALDLADPLGQRGLHLGHGELLPAYHAVPPKLVTMTIMVRLWRRTRPNP